MKYLFAFLAGAACVALGVMIGRGKTPAPLPSAGSVWFYAESRVAPLPDSPLNKIVTIDWNHLPLEKALDQLAVEGHINLVADWHSMEAEGVDRIQPVDFKLHDVTIAVVLDHLLATLNGPASLMYSVENNVVTVSGHKPLRTVAAMYDITEQLVALRHRSDELRKLWPGPISSGRFDAALFGEYGAGEASDVIIRWIEDSVDPESWKDNGGTDGAIRSFSGYLFIIATPANHARICASLDVLRHQ